MGFLLGSPGCLQSPLPSRSIPSSTSSFSLLLPAWSHRKLIKKKVAAVVASQHCKGSGYESGSLHRRAVLLVGISVLPLLELRAVALEGRGTRRGARTLDVARRRTQREKMKQNIETSKIQTPEVKVPKQTEQEVLSKEPNQFEVARQNASGDSSTISGEQDTRITEAKVAKQQEEKIPMILGRKDTIITEDQVTKRQQEEISSEETNQTEQVHQQTSSGNSFLSLLNAVGIIGSGVLGALYATSQKEKTEMESAIESMKAKLNGKEAAVALLKEDYERRLLNEKEEQRKQISNLKEEEASLSCQLASANGTVAALHQELHNERRLLEDLKAQIGQLESKIAQADEDKKVLEAKIREKIDTIDVLQDRISLLTLEINDKEKSIENLRLSLAEKESECKTLSSTLDQTKEDLAEINSTAEHLKEENFKIKEDLNLKNSSMDALNGKIKSLDAERDRTTKSFHNLVKEYDDWKSSTERKITLDSELLSKRDDELHQLEKKLMHALSEAGSNQAIIAELTEERDDLRAMLEKEVNSVKILKDELQITQEELGASRNEVSILSNELDEVKRLCEEVTSKLSETQDEFSEAKKSFASSLDEAKSAMKILSEELASVKGVLKSTTDELGVATNELEAVMEERESIEKELVDIYKKAETSTRELKEERNIIATLNRELEVMGKQMQKDSEGRRALEADLEEATKSLDEMNKSALLLSRELEDTNSRTSSLEVEKEILYKSLVEQKNLAKEAKENLEDAQNLITRLGSERESLEKRAKKLEDELAATKGEILRLRREISMGKETVNERPQNTNQIPAGTPFATRKTASRRRKGGAASDDS